VLFCAVIKYLWLTNSEIQYNGLWIYQCMNKSYSFVSSKIRVWFLVLIILTPAVIALPAPMSWEPFRYKEVSIKVDLMNGSPLEKTLFPIPNKIEAVGKSPFLSLLGIETGSMPTYLCVNNTSTIIYHGDKIIDSQTFLNEGGLADIYIGLIQDNTGSPIKIPLASSICEFIIAKTKSGLENEVTWGARPTAQLENVLFSIDGKIGFEFKLGIYIKNYLILLGGLIILLSSLIQVLQFSIRNKKIKL